MIEMSLSDADFQRSAAKAATNVQKILQSVSSLQRMVATIGTSQDTPAFQKQLKQLQHSTGQLAKETSEELKNLNQTYLNNQHNGQDNRQWKLQKDRLADDFTSALNAFQAAQRTAAAKEKEAIKKAKAESQQQHGYQLDLEAGGQQENSQQAQRQRQLMLEEEESISNLQERERAIHQLESDILDVNTIFKDLATMVHEQGEMVDSIEANVESTSVRVSEGTAELAKAERFAVASRKKKLICAAIAVVVLIVIIIIIAKEA